MQTQNFKTEKATFIAELRLQTIKDLLKTSTSINREAEQRRILLMFIGEYEYILKEYTKEKIKRDYNKLIDDANKVIADPSSLNNVISNQVEESWYDYTKNIMGIGAKVAVCGSSVVGGFGVGAIIGCAPLINTTLNSLF